MRATARYDYRRSDIRSRRSGPRQSRCPADLDGTRQVVAGRRQAPWSPSVRSPALPVAARVPPAATLPHFLEHQEIRAASWPPPRLRTEHWLKIAYWKGPLQMWALRLRMSALGHKRTYAVHQPMSALPPIATSIAQFGMLGHKRSFDDLIGSQEKRPWN